MTQQEIIEANRLLAEFMGIDFINKNVFVNRLPKDFLKNSDCYKCFHGSWGWLMPVVNRIAHVCEPTTDCPINRKRLELFKSVTVFSDISEVYKCCVDFVQWYNENKAI